MLNYVLLYTYEVDFAWIILQLIKIWLLTAQTSQTARTDVKIHNSHLWKR